MTKIKFVYWNLHNQSIRGETRWIDGSKMPDKERYNYLSRWQFKYPDWDFRMEKVEVEDPLQIDEKKVEMVEVLDQKTKLRYQRLSLNA